MEKVDFSKVLKDIKFHASVLARGFARTLYGALVAGLLAVAVYGFILIKSETGYLAVCDFIASTATLAVAMSNMYVMGKKKRGGKK